jgi:hypothetical protein
MAGHLRRSALLFDKRSFFLISEYIFYFVKNVELPAFEIKGRLSKTAAAVFE